MIKPGRLLMVSVLSLVLLLMGSCKEDSDDRIKVASVGDRHFYKDQLDEMIPRSSSQEDSTYFADQYLESWIREQVVLKNAEERLTEEDKDFSKEIEVYRNSLLNYTYEKAIIEKRLDTLISDEEIVAYYEENLDNFILKDYIVQVKFCILDPSVNDLDEFRNLFRSSSSEDLVALEQFCVKNNASYYLKVEDWLYFSELKETLPLEVFNTEKFLRSNKVVEFSDEEKLYFLKIENYRLKDSQSPLSLQKNNIKNMILNKRKNKLISQLKDDLYRDALKKGEIKRYNEE